MKDKFNMGHIFGSKGDFDNTLACCKDIVGRFVFNSGEFKDKEFSCDGKTVEYVKHVLDERSLLSMKLQKLYTYTSLNYDINQKDDTFKKMQNEVINLSDEISSSTKYITTTLGALGDDVLEYLECNESLKSHSNYFKSLRKNKKRILSLETEEVLSTLGGNKYDDIYERLTTCELPFDEVIVGGEVIKVDYKNYQKYSKDQNRDVRESVYRAHYGSYQKFGQTLSDLMNAHLSDINRSRKIRKYDSMLQSSLDGDGIDVSVYKAFISAVKSHIPELHDILRYKKSRLGVDVLMYHDLKVPLMSMVKDFSYDDAVGVCLEGASVIGDGYKAVFDKAFGDSWIDVYPAEAKRTGAYMNGSVYDVHPYILLNYQGKIGDVSTLAHELGHAVHSYFSNRVQPFEKSRYSTFTAEIASITAELVVTDALAGKVGGDVARYIKEYNIDQFRTTLFRQAMFAEFELWMSEVVENGGMITLEEANSKYLSLLREYHGHDDGVCVIDDYCAAEWLIVPHFYYDFYVWQYSTSFINSVVFFNRIKGGDASTFLKMLESGGSEYPFDILESCGVDFEDADIFKPAFEYLSELLTSLKA